MVPLFQLAALGAIVVGLLVLGWGAVNAGVDTRPGFCGEDERFPEHHDMRGSF